MSGYRTPPDFPARIVRYRITSRLATVCWTLFGAVFGILFIAAMVRSGADLTIDRTHATVSVVVRGLSWKSRRKQFPLAQWSICTIHLQKRQIAERTKISVSSLCAPALRQARQV